MIYDINMNEYLDDEARSAKHFVAACALTDMSGVEGLVFAGTFHGTVIDGQVRWIEPLATAV
jgi:hypothetical protein